jgi:imidazolonepropionase-like amidohydrolase
MKTLIRNGHVLDTATMTMGGETNLLIEDGRIARLGADAATDADLVIDADGQFVLPGLIDAHVHFRLATLDFSRLAVWTEVEYGIAMARLARETLARGFTTVRDIGGDVRGLMRAIRTGAIPGPRIFHAGRMLSQTGGHADAEGGPRDVPTCACEMRHTAFGIVADGAEAVRKAARHNLRDGVDFLKIHVSGGVATPSDPLDSVQYTAAEIAAAVEEAAHRRTYVAAHAYLPESISMAVANGVHSIEHGNMLDSDSAADMARAGAVLVPTLVTYVAMQEVGKQLGLPQTNIDKNRLVTEAGIASLETAKAAGVTMGFGTDLIGETQPMQNREFLIRAEAQSPAEILHAMYVVNAQLMRLEGEVGVIAPGAAGDIVIARGNPLDDISVLGDPAANFSHILQAGRPVAR